MNEKILINIDKKVTKLSKEIDKARIADYINMLENPKRLLYINFLIGLARGFGTAIGLTVLAALSIYVLTQFVDLPLIGSYVAKLLTIIENYR